MVFIIALNVLRREMNADRLMANDRASVAAASTTIVGIATVTATSIVITIAKRE